MQKSIGMLVLATVLGGACSPVAEPDVADDNPATTAAQPDPPATTAATTTSTAPPAPTTTEVVAQVIVPGPITADAAAMAMDWDLLSEGGGLSIPGVVEVFTGAGDTVLDLEAPLPIGVVSLRHEGRSNFIVRVFFTDNDERGIVNEIGAYTGRTLAHRSGVDVAGLSVRADGPWVIVVQSIAIAQTGDAVASAYEGAGDFVIVFPFGEEGPAPITAFSRATFSHEGSSNFIVRELLGSGLVNHIGPYQGTVRLSTGGIFGFVVSADGPWTITLD